MLGTFIFLLYFAFWILAYFIPSMVAKNKRDFGPIFVLNLFLGWTFVGWVIALVWACRRDFPEGAYPRR